MNGTLPFCAFFSLPLILPAGDRFFFLYTLRTLFQFNNGEAKLKKKGAIAWKVGKRRRLAIKL